MKDFFVSYNGKDKEWAEWIAWQLEDAGFTSVIQAWDFRPGGNFVIDMQQAAEGTERTIAVLSQNYLDAMYTQQAGGDIVGGNKQVVNTGGGAYVEGKVDTGGGDFVGRDKITDESTDPNAIAEAFAKLYQALEQQPDTMQKNMTKQAVETLEAEAKKGDQADENKVKQGIDVILAMLPDIGEVAINTFINPVVGLSTAFQKIAQKVRENQQSK